MAPIKICLTALLTIICSYSVKAADEASGTLPVLHIETENRKPVVSKTEYLTAGYWLDPSGCEGVEALGSESEPLPLQIRGRGHSSWSGKKKPYKLKLASKTSIIGMPKNKHWALLKPTENTVAGLRLGRLMNMAWTPDFRPVEVILNGDYIGLYFLTETIRIDKNRVNIFEQKDQETDPEMIKGGWLVEVDNYVDDCQIYLKETPTLNLVIKYHSPEDLSDLQKQWLTDEFTDLNAAIYSTDKTSTDWENYMDVESIARFFIIQEVMDNPDGFHGSFYLHKDLGENAKWTAGPIWDLTCYNREKTDYTFRSKVHYTINSHWIGELIRYDSFCKAVGSAWKEVYPDKLSEIYDYIDSVVLPLETAWKKDCSRWDDNPEENVQFRTNRIRTALRRNIEWFNEHLPVSPYASQPTISAPATHTPVRVYNLQGMSIGEYPTEAEARSALPAGLYIINSRKVMIR